MKVAAAVVLALSVASPAWAQVDGYISLMGLMLPDLQPIDGNQRVSELRGRIFLERSQPVGDHVRFMLSGYVDGLVADRSVIDGSTRTQDAIGRPADLFVEIKGPGFDFRVGTSRIVWGRLDEFQPTDVVNPIDLTRFLLEGRSEARLATGLARARLFLPGSTTLEAIVVPKFRASQFDQLAEPSSPFNLAALTGVRVERQEPEFTRENFQGGLRLTSTVSRVDFGLSAFRGYRTFPTLTLLQTFAPPTTVLETFPLFTMVGADFETVRGPWGLRGEAAYFPRDTIQLLEGNIRGVDGRSLEAGLGGDRRAGSYRIGGNVLWSWNSVYGSDVSVVAAADRSFARETRTIRLFAIYNPEDETGFGRVIGAISLRDNVWIEGSGGIFIGSSLSTLGRLTQRDFAYARLKIYL